MKWVNARAARWIRSLLAYRADEYPIDRLDPTLKFCLNIKPYLIALTIPTSVYIAPTGPGLWVLWSSAIPDTELWELVAISAQDGSGVGGVTFDAVGIASSPFLGVPLNTYATPTGWACAVLDDFIIPKNYRPAAHIATWDGFTTATLSIAYKKIVSI